MLIGTRSLPPIDSPQAIGGHGGSGKRISILATPTSTPLGTKRPTSSLPVPETEQDVDFDSLAGGDRCRLRVLASDGVNTTKAVSDPFKRAVQPCYALILEPDNDTAYRRDDPVRLRGQGWYLEEREPEFDQLKWASSVDGPLGSGAMVEVSGLSPGAHTITLTAGREGRTGTTTVTIQIG